MVGATLSHLQATTLRERRQARTFFSMPTLLRPSPVSESWLAEALTTVDVPPHKADRLVATLTKRYCERWRHYHTLEHVAAMFAHAARHRDQLDDPAAFALAIWYHDAVYRPRRTDNEARSAELLLAECAPPAAVLPLPTTLTAASRLILATADHEAPADLADGPLFLDIDLAILGSAPDAYRDYSEAIRKEFRWVPRAIFAAKRADALKRFLNRPAIYLTPAFVGLEATARRNIATEIATLRT